MNMTLFNLLQIVLYLAILLLLVKPLGKHMSRVYSGGNTFLDPILRPIEKLIYRIAGVDPNLEMNWTAYAVAMLTFNLLGVITLYGLQRLQGSLPLNPNGFSSVEPDLAFNTAISFGSNTNWQNYGGETTLSYFIQMIGITVQNFASAGTGMAILVALIRGIVRASHKTIGNFWVDLTRSTLYIFLPLSLIFAIVLISQGVVQTLHGPETVPFIQKFIVANGQVVDYQTLAVGPVASQIAIKQLGTNGGGILQYEFFPPL
jgi:K+-transporting ATPase ATPase A chain